MNLPAYPQKVAVLYIVVILIGVDSPNLVLATRTYCAVYRRLSVKARLVAGVVAGF